MKQLPRARWWERSRWAAPGILTALFGIWCGTFVGGAGAAALAVASLSVLAVAAAGGDPRDPWRLGPARWLPWALLAHVVASLLVSPVPRAGRTAVVLLPAFLLLPGALAPAWSAETRVRTRRLLAVALLLVALLALVAWGTGRTPRPSQPLGHHNLLAAFLVALAPLALPLAGERRGWRLLGWGAAGAAAGTVVATRSVAGGLGLAAALLLLATPRRRLPALAVALLALALPLLAGGRGAELARGNDPSLRARQGYVAGALRGIAERPWFGWGPGATPWTLARHLRPEPGVNPPGEIVGDTHSLPATVGYELGLPGLLLLAGLALAVGRQARDTRDEVVRRGRAALAGFAVCALGGAPLAVSALPLVAATALGAAISHSGRPPATTTGGWDRWATRLYALGAALVLIPTLLAAAYQERAIGRDAPAAARALTRAARLDGLPLYAARLAWLLPPASPAAADRALAAARDAHSVGALWIAAGYRGVTAARPWGPRALREACRLDPLAAMPPFLLALADPAAAPAPARLALAFAAEPRLAAATGLAAHPVLWTRTRERLERLEAIDAGWRTAFLAATPRSVADSSRQPIDLRLETDSDPLLSLALHTFRRRPASASLAQVALDPQRLAPLAGLPAAPMPDGAWRALAHQAGCD